MSKKKVVGLIVVIFLLLGAGFGGWQLWKEGRASKQVVLSGNVDVREVTLAFRGSDRVSEMMVQEGDKVQQGEVLARLDSRELILGIQKIEAQIAAQQAAVDKLHRGTRQEEIEQARANYQSAQSAADNAMGIYQRRKKIYDSIAGISEQELDNARHEAEGKQAAATAAHQVLVEAQNGPRQEDVAAGEANLAALKAELQRQQYLLSQYELKAPADGVIRSKLLEVGDMASPQVAAFKLSLLDQKWVRVYVNETDLPYVYEGKKAMVTIDGRNDSMQGQVGYISSTAEFTPKTVQTDELRTSLVYEVRVYVDDADNALRLGMPATVTWER